MSLVLEREDGKAREHCALPWSVWCRMAVRAVGRVQVQRGGQRLVLLVEHEGRLVAALHLLQEHQVGPQAVQAQPQLVEGLAPAQGRAALVDVVADDAG